ncbi:hypothetical protein SAMN05444162_4662 [Paenibacillaceae bacterium GAS479]|nr:hypothetical protein SAMN05444162_4662 [Paenibacillaceae bacterium GAS479]
MQQTLPMLTTELLGNYLEKENFRERFFLQLNRKSCRVNRQLSGQFLKPNFQLSLIIHLYV